MIGLRHAFTPGVAVEVWLQAALQRRFGKMDLDTEARLRATAMSPQKALKIVNRLRKLVAHTNAPAWGHWQAYEAEEGYDVQERALKSDTIEGWFKVLPELGLVCDLGANTGHYSRMAARYASLVAVVAGTTLGMMLANVPAVLLGEVAARKLPMKLVHSIAAGIFALLGLLVLLGVGMPAVAG